jgi:hypothetical protein
VICDVAASGTSFRQNETLFESQIIKKRYFIFHAVTVFKFENEQAVPTDFSLNLIGDSRVQCHCCVGGLSVHSS